MGCSMTNEAANSDVEKVEKKKYPSDNYLNEILTNTEFAAVVPIEAVRCMARELMLSRTHHPNGMMQLSNELAEMLVEKLPAPMNVKMGGDAKTKAMFSGMNMMLEDCKKVIRAAGGTVEGSE